MKARLIIPTLLVLYHASFLAFIASKDGDTSGYFQRHIPMYLGTALFMVPVVRGYPWALALAMLISAYKAVQLAMTMPYGLPAFNWLSIAINFLVAILSGFFLFQVVREKRRAGPNHAVQRTPATPPSLT